MTPKQLDLDHYRTVQHAIPPTAVEIHIHNVRDPYFIQVSNVKEREKMLEIIGTKLLSVLKQTDCQKINENEELAPGTMAIVHRETSDEIDIPGWYSRAIIIKYNEKTSKYLTFLPDYGNYLELSHESFVTMPHDAINIPFVTYIMSLYNILPVKKIVSMKQKKIQIVMEEDWTSEIVDLSMQLISCATKTFFDHITTQKNGIKCGELYLIIDNQLVPLRQALNNTHCAVYLTNELLYDQNIIKSSGTSICSDSITSQKSSTDYNENNSNIMKNKRSIFHEILVSSNVEYERLDDIHDAKFHSSVIGALKQLSITNVRRLQSYIWPAISKGLDVLAVGPPKCGKTIGYAAPIASTIVNTLKYQVKHHPMALILCSSSSQVLYIQSIFGELLSNYENIKIIGASNGCTDRSLIAGIVSGCQIFISTPAFLLRFLRRSECHQEELQLVHISHLVIDDLDVLLNKHSNILTELLGQYTLVGKKNLQHRNMSGLQLVGAAQQWSHSVGKFTKIFTDPYICIGSFADAAIFCGIQLRPRLISREDKAMKIAELLGNYYQQVKTMIVCTNYEEAKELNEYLSNNFDIFFVHDKMTIFEIIETKEMWNAGVPGMYKVMISVDEVLSDLRITDVSWLIHYSVSVPSKSLFLFRFSTLMTNLKRKSRKVEVTIFIDDTNNLQFRGIMDVVKRSGATISPELLRSIERVSTTIERDKKEYAICNNIKSFGYCQRLGRCNFRHCILPDIDAPMTPLKIGNRIKFIILYVHNATHFSVRIIEYIDENGEKHVLSDSEHAKITSKVHHYYSIKSNRFRSNEVVVGGIYAYDIYFDEYVRVQVLDIVARDEKDAPLYVNLRCIDSGTLHNRVRASQLRQIPKELAEAPVHIFEVFLANLLPYDDESEWSRHANDCTHQWFSDQLTIRGAFLQGKVCLHLGNTIWVDPLEVRIKIPGYREMVNGSLTRHLTEQKFGIDSHEHMIALKKLCINSGIIDAEEINDEVDKTNDV